MAQAGLLIVMKNTLAEREREQRVCQGSELSACDMSYPGNCPSLSWGVALSSALVAPTPPKRACAHTHTVCTECYCYLNHNTSFHSDTFKNECPLGVRIDFLSFDSAFQFRIPVILSSASVILGLSSGLIFKKASWFHVLVNAS